MTKKTGGLHLRRSPSHGVVWLADGLITGGASDVSRRALGRRIAGSALAGDDQLGAAIETVANHPEIGIARALRDAHAIDDGDLHVLVSEHVLDTVFDLMRWPDGSFEFVVDEANADDVGVARPVDDVVAEARLRLDAWAAFDQRVVMADTVLALALDPGGDPTLVREEWAMLALIDGRRTVGDLVDLYGRGEYAVGVTLAELFRRGLIRPADNEGTAALIRRRGLVATLETDTPQAVDLATAPSTVTEPSDPSPASEPAEPALSVAVVPPADLSTTPDGAPGDGDGQTAPTEPVVTDAAPSGEAPSVEEPDTGSGLVTDLNVDIQMEASEAATPEGSVSSMMRSISTADSDFSTGREPFTASHQPDQPEALAASGGGTLTAAAPVAAGTIERDPSVNKSLLLRLIAGVRGL